MFGFFRWNDEIAPLDELLPRNMLRQIRCIEHALDPVNFPHAFGVIGAQPQSTGQGREDVVVGTGFPDRLDAFGLIGDDPVIDLRVEMRTIATGIGPLTNILTLQIGASRQDHISELHIAFVPDRLVDHEFEIWRPVHGHIPVGVIQGSQNCRTITVQHVHFACPCLGYTILRTVPPSFGRPTNTLPHAHR